MKVNLNGTAFVVVTEDELAELSKKLNQILLDLQTLKMIEKKASEPKPNPNPEMLPALAFMKAVHIGRWKFDQLVQANKIKTIKKKRKIYVPGSEVDRYFTDPDIQ
jgi:hypothetical protein